MGIAFITQWLVYWVEEKENMTVGGKGDNNMLKKREGKMGWNEEVKNKQVV